MYKINWFLLESRLYLLNIVHIVTKMQRLGKSIQTYWKNGLLKWNSSWDLVANSSEQNWMLVQTTMFFPIHVWENCTQNKIAISVNWISFFIDFVWSWIPDGESLPLFTETLTLHMYYVSACWLDFEFLQKILDFYKKRVQYFPKYFWK